MTCALVLKEKGFRLTRQRRLILDAVHAHGGHMTAEEVIRRVQGTMPRVNKSTIYRTLDLLEEQGRIFRTDSGEKTIFHHAEEGHHHHLVCRSCGATIECHEDVFAPVARSLAKKLGFTATFTHMVIPGVCTTCQGT